MLNWYLSILVYKEIIDEEEATYLSEKLPLLMYPTRFKDAYTMISDLLVEYDSENT